MAPTKKQVRTVTTDPLGANAPESGKRGLIRPASTRADHLFQLANRRGVDLLFGQEVGKNAKIEAVSRPRWRQVYSAPNSHSWGNHQGNAVFFRGDIWQILDRDQIHIDGALSLPVVLLEHKRTGWRIVVISFHAPTRRADRAVLRRRELRKSLRLYKKRLGDVPMIVEGDTNAGEKWARPLRFVGLRQIMRHHVDVMLVTRHFEVIRTKTLRRPKLSDHHFLHATLRGKRVGKQISHLPKEASWRAWTT